MKYRAYITYYIYDSIDVEASTTQEAIDKGYQYAERHHLEADEINIEVEEEKEREWED